MNPAARGALTVGAVAAVLGLIASGRPSISLYDGVVPLEPYVYLDPPAGSAGNPKGATATLDVTGGQSPLVAVATPELVPQAQLFAIPGALVLPAGSTRIDVSIAAVEPPAAVPSDGHIEGNVYAIAVTNQAGAALTADPEAQVSIILRAPDPLTATATIARFDGTTWVSLKTDPSGLGATFTAVVTQFGDFAVLLPGPAPTGAATPAASAERPSATPPISPGSAAASPVASPAPGGPLGLDRQTLTLVLGGLAVLIVVLVAAAALLPSRRGPPGGGRSGATASRRRDRR